MFSNAIETFRAKTNDIILHIDDDANSDKSYEACCDFLDEYAYDDNEDICSLNDYITYGGYGEGKINKRLLGILASLCTQYMRTTSSVMNNKSYCNSSITSF